MAASDRVEVWQERGPLEDLFAVATLLDEPAVMAEWPFGYGRFHFFRGGRCVVRIHPSAGRWFVEREHP